MNSIVEIEFKESGNLVSLCFIQTKVRFFTQELRKNVRV